MSARLQGKVAIITGGASGIGAGTAEIMAGQGALVVVADVNVEAADNLAASIRAGGGRADSIAVDLAEPDSIREMIDGSAKRHGGLDVLFNNAADTRLSSTRDSGVEDMDIEVWDQLMQINLRGTMLASKFAIPHLRTRGGGSIINMASGAGLTGSDGITAYGVGKAGVIMLSQYIATQHGKDGIRCNSIAPGLIVTPGLGDRFGSGPMANMLLRHTLMPRNGAPSDIAWAVVWLASDEATYVTGQCIAVDGGLQSHQPYWADGRAMVAQ